CAGSRCARCRPTTGVRASAYANCAPSACSNRRVARSPRWSAWHAPGAESWRVALRNREPCRFEWFSSTRVLALVSVRSDTLVSGEASQPSFRFRNLLRNVAFSPDYDSTLNVFLTICTYLKVTGSGVENPRQPL